MSPSPKVRRVIALIIFLIIMAIPISQTEVPREQPSQASLSSASKDTLNQLDELAVKGRAPKTDYSRSQFGNGWTTNFGCDTRNIILKRDLQEPELSAECKVLSGVLQDPYTGKTIPFARGETTSDDVQIDHVVALSNAWQTGAQQLTYERRVEFANDPLNLLAVDGPANEQKSDGDAATWLPPNKPFRCQYVTRQISVKFKFSLWVTTAEKVAMRNALAFCP